MPATVIPSMDPRHERRVGNPEGLARRVGELERRVGRYTVGGDVFKVQLPLSSPWVNYGIEYVGAFYSRYGRLVVVDGLINRPPGPPAAGETLAVLPEGFRPSYTLIFHMMSAGGAARIDVRANGTIAILTAVSMPAATWISLSGIQFLL